MQEGHAVDRQAVKRHVLTLGAVAVAALALVVLGPAYLRQGLSALLIVILCVASVSFSNTAATTDI